MLNQLLDHLVGKREQRRRHGNFDGARGLQIDREREPRWFLAWQIGNLSAFQNAVDILRSPEVIFDKVDAVGNQRPIRQR
jgi:hypothetical protein